MTLLDIVSIQEGELLFWNECADWLTRPCCGTQPDEFSRDSDPEWSRSIGEVQFFQHGERQ